VVNSGLSSALQKIVWPLNPIFDPKSSRQ
jgi:hypothetical protein